MFYIGAGTSGRLGVLDASECPPTFSVPYDMVQGIIAGGETALSRATEASEDDPASGERDLLGGDSAPPTCSSGSRRAVALLTCSARSSALGRGRTDSRHRVLPGRSWPPPRDRNRTLTGPEIVTGSTRMKAGTATKLALNMITTASMVKLGYVYGNLMVNVQPRNEKLRDRARRIVRDATGSPTDSAEALLADAGDVRTAMSWPRGTCRVTCPANCWKPAGCRKGLEWKNC